LKQVRVANPAAFQDIFARLRASMHAQRGSCAITADQADLYNLETQVTGPGGKKIWFGKVEIGKAYVSYHLMPIYIYPDLLAEISPALKKRMQGKSCFRFTQVDEPLFAELEELTRRSVAAMRERGFPG
jgi:hypothetical protein